MPEAPASFCEYADPTMPRGNAAVVMLGSACDELRMVIEAAPATIGSASPAADVARGPSIWIFEAAFVVAAEIDRDNVATTPSEIGVLLRPTTRHVYDPAVLPQ